MKIDLSSFSDQAFCSHSTCGAFNNRYIQALPGEEPTKQVETRFWRFLGVCHIGSIVVERLRLWVWEAGFSSLALEFNFN